MTKRSILLCLTALAALGLLMAPAPSLAEEHAVIIGFKEKPGPAEQALVHSHGGKVKQSFRLIRAMAAKLPKKNLDKLKSHPNVAYIEDDATAAAIEPVAGGIEYDSAWGVSRIGAPQVHLGGIAGAGVRIAVLDTGIDYTHPELAARYRGGDNFISLDPDFHDPLDDSWNSHGTHVAGVLAAEANGSGVIGVAPQAELYAVKVLDGAGFGALSSIIAGLQYAVDNGMHIANLSLGISVHYQSLEAACAAAEGAGVLLVAAAGNSNGGPVMYPAAYESVIAVGATTIEDQAAYLSAVGPQLELAAPGLGIYSTLSTLKGSFGYLSGTSQAAPHVAGVTALLISNGLSDWNGDGLVNHRDARYRLRQSAADLGATGHDEIFGYGLVSASAALAAHTTIAEFTVTTAKKKDSAGTKQLPLAAGRYLVTISNESLSNIEIEVYEAGMPLPELERSYRFWRKSPQTVSFELDTLGRDLDLEFLPAGKAGTTATVTIETL